MLVCARLRRVIAISLGIRRYMNMDFFQGDGGFAV